MRGWLPVLLVLFTVAARDAGALDIDRAPDWEARMLDQINADRRQRGLPRFRADRRLEASAADHARHMARQRRLSHRLPGEPVLRDRVAATGLRFDSVGENVGYSTRVAELHRNLMRSPGHREHLLSRKYDSIGIAIFANGGRYYVTQDFARTTSEASEPEAERAFAGAVAALRRRHGLPPVPVNPTRALHDTACAMARRDDVDASVVPHESGQRHVVVFTTFEPAELSRAAREAAIDPEARRITIGVCHRESPRYPSGVFWFAIAY
jgi:uncharacterized protein YkwD